MFDGSSPLSEAVAPDSTPWAPFRTIKATFRQTHAADNAERQPAQPPGWILSVPDTRQLTRLEALEQQPKIRVIHRATEAEANNIAAGHCIGGEPALLMS